jgi:hypothetical protein
VWCGLLWGPDLNSGLRQAKDMEIKVSWSHDSNSRVGDSEQMIQVSDRRLSWDGSVGDKSNNAWHAGGHLLSAGE